VLEAPPSRRKQKVPRRAQQGSQQDERSDQNQADCLPPPRQCLGGF
jgi:hypothetical protein